MKPASVECDPYGIPKSGLIWIMVANGGCHGDAHSASFYQERKGRDALVAELKRALAARSAGAELFTLFDAGL